ncbi:MAG: S8 family serine peptidase [Saprospirales bacterium]|nr:S8 family serine peptidase [Saprospirales bacterium]
MKQTATASLAICLFFLLALPRLSAQHSDLLYLRSGVLRLPENAGDFDMKEVDPETERVGDQFFRLIRFEQIPTAGQRQRLAEDGILLLDYIPHKAYIASLPAGIGAGQLLDAGIRSLAPIPQHLKVAQNLLELPYPDWALRRGKLELSLKYYSSLPVEEVLAYCSAFGIEIVRQNGRNNFLLAAIDPEKVAEIARLPFVAYLELAPEPGEPEDFKGRNLHRTNAIDTEFPSGRHYTGEGVHALVRDDGFVGAHIDFHNRLDQEDVNSDSGTHGDQVSSVVGGAGNLDPKAKGMAAGSIIHTLNYVPDFLDSTLSLHLNSGVLVTNTSYSQGCNEGYSVTSQTVDQQLYAHPTFLHVFSAGNAGAQNCGYGAGSGWGNITGGHKQSKNSMAVAALTSEGLLSNFSSRGPATDGRLKPDIAGFGEDVMLALPGNTYSISDGTSYSAPAIAGIAAQLHQAYSESNAGQIAEAALLKAVMLNTANDLGNEGPDFKFGWGHVNAYRAALSIEEKRFFEGEIEQDGLIQHLIDVPAGVLQARIMVCWSDPEGSEFALKALVNDLDMEIENPAGPPFRPLILNPSPSPAMLDLPAFPGRDSLNNVEQIRISNPGPGPLSLFISGTEIPFGPQKYWVTYDFYYDEITLTHPYGGEGFAPGEVEIIHWDAHGVQDSFLVEYSIDNGSTWTPAATLAGNARLLQWTVPEMVTGKAFVRVSRNGISGQNEIPFSIVGVPANLQIGQACPGFIRLEWDSVPGAQTYDVFLLGDLYMDSVGTTADLFYDVPAINGNPTLDHWFSVRATGEGGLRGRRAVAIPWSEGLFNCTLQNDLAIARINNPGAGFTSCDALETLVSVDVWNNGSTDQADPEISFQLGNEPVVTESVIGIIPVGDTVTFDLSIPLELQGPGLFDFRVWVHIPDGTDEAGFNDTLSQQTSVVIYPGPGVSGGIAETFEGNIPPDYWHILNDDGDYTFEAKEVLGADGLPTTAMWVDNYYYNNSGAEDVLITFPYDLSGAGPDIKLTFDLSYAVWDLVQYWEALRIDVYTDCGSTFAGTVYYKEKDILATVPPQTFPFEPQDSSDWRKEIVDLADFAGESLVIHFINITGYGNSLYIDNVNVEHIVLPQAGILVSEDLICQGETVVFEEDATGEGLSFLWDFGTGSEPPSAIGPGPHTVYYLEQGFQIASLLVYDGSFYDSAYQLIAVKPLPIVDFQFTSMNGEVTFTNNSIYGLSYSWNFGDDAFSTEQNPVHTYESPGTFTVTLTVTNDCGSVELSKDVVVQFTGTEDLSDGTSVVISPNPNQGQFDIILKGYEGRSPELRILDTGGREVWTFPSGQQSWGTYSADLSHLPKGMYELVIRTAGEIQTLKIVVQ